MVDDRAQAPSQALPVEVCERAWAKVNLTFEVGARRSDGYHEVRSLMAAVDWCDVVRVRRGGRPGAFRLKVRGHGAPRGRRNLALRAAEAWAAQDPGLSAVSLELTKRIPSGAGLGGGSSDAGAVLRALTRLRPGAASAALAAALGSDVPFFVDALALAEASGRGERLEPAGALPATWRVVLALPAFALATPLVYRRLDALRAGAEASAPGGATTRLRERLAAVAAGGGRPAGEHALMEIDAIARNDLWPAALSLRPELETVRERLRLAVGPGRPVAMTGSGSALYALVEDAGRAAHAVRRLRADGLRAVAARPLEPRPGAP